MTHRKMVRWVRALMVGGGLVLSVMGCGDMPAAPICRWRSELYVHAVGERCTACGCGVIRSEERWIVA